MDQDQVREIVNRRIPSMGSIQSVEKIEGGHLNRVWRVQGSGISCIVKYAPPYIATQPDIPLALHRALIESRALDELNEGPLQSVPTKEVQVPRLLDFDEDRNILFMEHIPHDKTLGDYINKESDGRAMVKSIAKFVAGLHSETHDSGWAASYFDNTPMQETRLEVQYRPVGDLLKQEEVADADSLGTRANKLGESLLEPGKCMIMGDLWPPSVLVGRSRLWLIDWELSHYGRPLQDIGHLSAHLWLYARARRLEPEPWINSFLATYREALGSAFKELWDERELAGTAVHMGAEIIARVLGAFKNNYLQGTYLQGRKRTMAIKQAVKLISSEEEASLLQPLRYHSVL